MTRGWQMEVRQRLEWVETTTSLFLAALVVVAMIVAQWLLANPHHLLSAYEEARSWCSLHPVVALELAGAALLFVGWAMTLEPDAHGELKTGTPDATVPDPAEPATSRNSTTGPDWIRCFDRSPATGSCSGQ